MADPVATLCHFIATAGPDDLLESDRRLICQATLDCLGVALAGSRLPAPRALARLLQGWGGSAIASAWGFGFRTTPAQAALLNGTAAHAHLYDDTSVLMVGHPSSPLLPALLALAEERRLPGQTVMVAYAVGFEVQVRLARWLQPEIYEAGWHVTSVIGTLGAAAGVARLLGLDAGRCRAALGIAASLAAGVRQNFGTDTMGLHAGHAAHDGLLAAHLAAAGVGADASALTGRYGFAAAFAPVAAAAGEERMRAALAAPFAPLELTRSGLNFKLYPSGQPVQAAVDAAIALVQAHQPAPEAISAIECGVHPWNFKTLRQGLPQDAMGAKVSLEYNLARALLDGDVQLEHFRDAAVRQPAVVSLMQRVRVVVDPELPDNGEFPARVTLYLTDGRRLSHRRDAPRGSATQPLTDAEVQGKFRQCSRSVLAPAAVQRCIDLVFQLWQATDVRELCRLLRSAAPSGKGLEP